MDEGSAAESVIVAFSLQEAVSEVVECVVDQANESLEGFESPCRQRTRSSVTGWAAMQLDLGNGFARTGRSKLPRRLVVSQCNERAV